MAAAITIISQNIPVIMLYCTGVNHARLRSVLGTIWLAGMAVAMYVVIFHHELIVDRLQAATAASFIAGGVVYLLLGCLRGFTLIPATYLVVVGVIFFPPLPLFLLTLVSILVSSASVYYFSEALHLDELLTKKHAAQVDRLRHLLDRYGLPIIIGWAFFPLAPTDLICYLSGVLRIRIATVLLGVAIGEGSICALYIFFGGRLLRLL
jgi:uncharacterized membrane protein YdjX (TVP38/TMEM64 family)